MRTAPPIRPRPDAAPLSIALDASLWDEPTTGIGLYTRRLAAALEKQGVRVRRMGARHSGENPRGESSRTVYFLGKLSEILAGIEEPLFHGLCNFNLPPVRVPGKRMVLTVHDVIPELLPQTVSLAYRWQFRLWLTRSVRIADRIICVSRKTRDDLLQRFQLDEAKLSVVYHGVDHVNAIPTLDATGAAFLQSLALPERYVLYEHNGANHNRQSCQREQAGAIPVRNRPGAPPRRCCPIQHDSIHTHRLGDVLYPLCTDIPIGQPESISDLPIDTL